MTRTFSYIGDGGLEVSFDITTQDKEDAVVRAFFEYQRDQRRAYRDLDTGADHPSWGRLKDLRDYLRNSAGTWPVSLKGFVDILRAEEEALSEEIAAFDAAKRTFESTATGSIVNIRALLNQRRDRKGEQFQVRVTVPPTFFSVSDKLEVMSVAKDYEALGMGLE